MKFKEGWFNGDIELSEDIYIGAFEKSMSYISANNFDGIDDFRAYIKKNNLESAYGKLLFIVVVK